KRVEVAIERIFDYVFAKFKYPGIPQMKLTQINNNPFYIDDLLIIPVRGMHHKLPVFGFRIGEMAYLTDINYIAPEEKKKLYNLKVLIVNALRKEEHVSHYNLEQALALIEELKPEKAYLTHISHQLGLYDEVSSELPLNVFLAYDGLKIIC
ncbi:MAG: MBL fold metallo-hydrolase, partial [Prolixibacteraceae bacterium]|nr:MBL fold metallo-hydrolase [Prolixibacteraceae bacterium]